MTLMQRSYFLFTLRKRMRITTTIPRILCFVALKRNSLKAMHTSKRTTVAITQNHHVQCLHRLHEHKYSLISLLPVNAIAVVTLMLHRIDADIVALSHSDSTSVALVM